MAKWVCRSGWWRIRDEAGRASFASIAVKSMHDMGAPPIQCIPCSLPMEVSLLANRAEPFSRGPWNPRPRGGLMPQAL